MDRFQPGARADALQILQAYSNRFASLGTLPSLPEARFLGFGFNELSRRWRPSTTPRSRRRSARSTLPEGGFKEDLDGFVTIEVALKSLSGLPAPEGADSAPNSRPGTGKKDEKRKSIKKDKKKDDEASPPRRAPDPAKEAATVRRRWSSRRPQVPGLLVSVLKATPPTAEAIADHAAAFGADIPGNSDREQIKLVEAAKLDFNGDFLASLEPPPEDGSAEPDKKRSKPRGTITVVVRLNPGDDD
ncbi:indole-3-glycerol-phosphate synthase [Aureococcus anophagefferens]|nr:indole-3-glycerol-phosphate synthase [Aureococcus anophagefferens]